MYLCGFGSLFDRNVATKYCYVDSGGAHVVKEMVIIEEERVFYSQQLASVPISHTIVSCQAG